MQFVGKFQNLIGSLTYDIGNYISITDLLICVEYRPYLQRLSVLFYEGLQKFQNLSFACNQWWVYTHPVPFRVNYHSMTF